MITPPYRILHYREFPCLLCLVCNQISHHPNDVTHHYCGRCHVFLDDLPELLRQDAVEGRSPGLLLTGADDDTGFDLALAQRLASLRRKEGPDVP